MTNDQQAKTRSYVAEHLKFAHRSQPNDATGCMICEAWSWARETKNLDVEASRRMLESIAPDIAITVVPSGAE